MMRSKKTGVVLLNMGGPDSLESVRPFLFNLFSDRKIIRLGPAFLQRPIAWMIARRRAPKSALNYQKIGGRSPLLEITARQAGALEAVLNKRGPRRFICRPGMRYWHPRTPDQLRALKAEGVVHVVGLSMYPHYSLATSGTSLDEFKREARRIGMGFSVVESYPDHPLYIEALKKAIEAGMERIGDRTGLALVYSAHSLPKALVDSGDPYVEHLKRTVAALEGLTGIRGSLCFQSRSGPVEWLEPATDTLLVELAEEGIKEILCLPISFVSDHIETLYEIDMLYGRMMERRGVRLVRTPSLNESPVFIEALAELVIAGLN